MSVVVYQYKTAYKAKENMKKSTSRMVHFVPGTPIVSEEVMKHLTSLPGVRKQLRQKGTATIPHDEDLIIKEKNARHGYESIVIRKGSRRITINWIPIKRNGWKMGKTYWTVPVVERLELGSLIHKGLWEARKITSYYTHWTPSKHRISQFAWDRINALPELANGGTEVRHPMIIEVNNKGYYNVSHVKIINAAERRVELTWETTRNRRD